jgi:hypothetical protein
MCVQNAMRFVILYLAKPNTSPLGGALMCVQNAMRFVILYLAKPNTSPLGGALMCVQNAMRFVEPAVSLLLPDLPNKKGHLKVTFVIWHARQESNLQPPA